METIRGNPDIKRRISYVCPIQYFKMKSLLFNSQIVVTLGLCLFLANCKQTTTPTTAQADNCAQYQKEFSSITEPTNPDSLASVNLRLLFSKTANECPSISKRILAKLFRVVARNPMDTVITHFFEEKGNDISLDKKLRAAAFFNRASCYLFLVNNVDSGLSYLDKSKAFEKEFDDTTYRGYYALMAQVMVQKSKYTEAADYYVKAISLSDKIRDSGYAANLYSNFASLFTNMGDHKKAIEMKLKPLPYYQSKNDEYELMTSYASISSSYALLKKYDSAIAYNFKGMALIDKGINNLFTSYYLYINQGTIYAEIEKYDSAKMFFDKGKSFLKDLDNPMYEMQFVIASTTAYATVKDVSQEIEKIKGYIPALQQNEDLINLRDSYESVFRYALTKNQKDTALVYNRRRDSIINLIAAKDNKNYISELETKYETQKKELQIQVQEKEINRKNTLNGLLVALLIMAGLGAAFSITRMQLTRNRKDARLQQEFTHQLLQNTEEERARIARDLHDSVSQELLLLKHQVKKGTTEETSGTIDTLINEIRMIARDLHPVMLDQVGLKPSVEHICNRMMETNQIFITADINYNKSLPKNKELQLFRIIQESLNNVVKYAGAEAAKVTITETGQHINVEIQDNGKGFDVQLSLTEKMSFGLVSIIERSKTLGGKADIKSSPEGTIIKIDIPINA